MPGQFFGWEKPDANPRTASKAIATMDRRTWQALTTGYVELPRRRIHAGLWFRLLRTLLDELNTPLSACRTCAGYLRHISLEQLRATFVKKGFPPEFLSHYEPDEPFACLRVCL